MANKSIGLLTVAFGADLRGFEKAMKKAQRSIKKFGTNMQRTGKNLSRNLTLPLAAFAAASVKAFDTQIKAETKLLTALKGREDIQKRLIAQAKELQTKTLFGDEATIESQALLASLGLTEEQIMMLIPQIQNMATGLSMDLVGATSLVAKSVSTTTDALARYFNTGLKGVTGQQERAIILTQSLSEKFKGQAEEARKVGMGPMQALAMALGDVSEEFGALINENIQPLVVLLEKLTKKLSELTTTQKQNIIKWGAITAAVGPFLILIGKTFTSIAFLIPLIVRLGGAFKKLSILMFNLIKKNPWLLLATGIAAVGTIIADSLGAFDKWLGTEEEVQEETDKTTETINELNDALLNVDKTITKVSTNKPEIFKDLVFTPTQPLGEFMSPISGQFAEEMSLATEQFGEFGEKLIWVTEKQKRLNGITTMFEEIMTSAMTSAAYSSEGFFQGFIQNIKQVIKQLLVQLAVITAIKFLIGGPGVAGNLAKAFSLAKDQVFQFANGGLVTGPTLGMVGEGTGITASNPEVIAPLDKLKSMIGGGTQQVEVYGRISGNDIFISNQRGGINRLRSV